jgi:hypothetical protein
MLSTVELKRILTEWHVRLRRVQSVLQPPVWNEDEWRQFAQALTLMVQRHGTSWIDHQSQTWDLRWQIRDGGDLVCQVEQHGEQKVTLVVAQCGGFAGPNGSYTWLWSEFGPDGRFSRDPYWVEGSWKEALMTFLLPYQYQTNFLLQGRAETPSQLFLGHQSTTEGASPYAP